VLLVSLYPILYAVRLSLHETEYLRVGRFVGVANFVRASLDPRIQHSVGVSLTYVFGSQVLVLPIGLGLAIQQGIAAGERPYYKPRSREMVNCLGHPRPELSRTVQDGEYTLTGQNVLNRRRFADGVAYDVKAGIPVNQIPHRCLVPIQTDGLLLAGNCISVMPGSTFMGLQQGSYNNIKDIPSMWTNGEAAGTAAALCVQDHVQPRKLDVQDLQAVLRDRGALVSPEQITDLEAVRLPSGRTAKEYYEATMADCRAYWGGRGGNLD
jgi:FAD-dependent oxidoreductase family protein